MCPQIDPAFQNTRARRIPMRSLPIQQTTPRQRVDLRQWMSPVEDQEDLGSCAANACAGILEYLLLRHHKMEKDVSRLFMYYNARSLSTNRSHIRDEGTYLTSTIQALVLYGACEEHIWPYERELVNVKPSKEAYEAAKQYTVSAVRIPTEQNAICKSLNRGLPVVIGIVLRNQAGEEARRNGGIISFPNPRATTVRNSEMHAVVICGYDHREKYYIVRNSWGTNWGLNGYFYLPYDYLKSSRLVNDGDGAWTITQIQLRQQALPTLLIARYENEHGQRGHNKDHRRHKRRHRQISYLKYH